MNSRLEFNQQLLVLLNEMTQAGEHWLIDFVKRSDEEQERLFKAGKSKCDGKAIISYHQFGRAVDLYFQSAGLLVDPYMGWNHWHDRWEALGGHHRIEWDMGHFEG
jgi:hypothetical protein